MTQPIVPASEEIPFEQLPPTPKRTTMFAEFPTKNNRPPLTPYRRMGARRAMSVGLAEYLEDVKEEIDGKLVRLATVTPDWARPEQIGKYPGACIYSENDAPFDSNSFNSYVTRENEIPSATQGQQSLYLAQTAELEQRLFLHVVCTNPGDRGLVEEMLTNALLPTDEFYGLCLLLPHYHSVLAVYELQTVRYIDNPEDAKTNYREMVFGLDVQVPTVVVRSYSKTTDQTFRMKSDVLQGNPPKE